jgi:KUP system potassium uptake protein
MSDAGIPPGKIIKSLGLVFGDIGTSPIYTVGAILLFMLPTTQNIFGLLSLITWTLFIVITFQYIWLAMSLSDKGEGGIIVLKNILDSHLTPGLLHRASPSSPSSALHSSSVTVLSPRPSVSSRQLRVST